MYCALITHSTRSSNTKKADHCKIDESRYQFLLIAGIRYYSGCWKRYWYIHKFYWKKFPLLIFYTFKDFSALFVDHDLIFVAIQQYYLNLDVTNMYYCSNQLQSLLSPSKTHFNYKKYVFIILWCTHLYTLHILTHTYTKWWHTSLVSFARCRLILET